jgi:TRAP transporter TAXI family solute receptor
MLRKGKPTMKGEQIPVQVFLKLIHSSRERAIFSVFIGIAVLLLAGSNAGADEANLRLLRIGTGGKTGVYYPIGKIIAQGLTTSRAGANDQLGGEQGIPGTIGVAQNSAGSIENVKKVAAGEIEAGLVQADVAAWAFRAERVFKGNEQVRRIRAIASLYPEKFQIVVRQDANIHSVNDLKGKRISIDEIGSGTLAVMRIVLAAHHMSEKDLLPVYLKPVFTHDKVVSGELQGFVMMAGAPMVAVSQLAKIGVSLVPIAPEVAVRIEAQYPYLVPGRIPAGVYAGIPEIPTIQVHAILIVSEAMDDMLAHRLTTALWSQRTLALLEKGHPQGKSILPSTALVGISIPLHPGAEKYYRKHPMRFESTKQ